MITGRIVHDPPRGWLVGISKHVDYKISVIDAVFPFIQENPRAGGSWIDHVYALDIDFPTLLVLRSPRSGITPAWTADPVVHRHAANARNNLSFVIYGRAFVGWAFPNSHGVSAIRPENTLPGI